MCLEGESLPVAAFAFNEWVKEGIDGLLGFDLILQFDLEMKGREGILRVFQRCGTRSGTGGDENA